MSKYTTIKPKKKEYKCGHCGKPVVKLIKVVERSLKLYPNSKGPFCSLKCSALARQLKSERQNGESWKDSVDRIIRVAGPYPTNRYKVPRTFYQVYYEDGRHTTILDTKFETCLRPYLKHEQLQHINTRRARMENPNYRGPFCSARCSKTSGGKIRQEKRAPLDWSQLIPEITRVTGPYLDKRADVEIVAISMKSGKKTTMQMAKFNRDLRPILNPEIVKLR